MENEMVPKIVIERDFDGYFEAMVRGWYANMLTRNILPKRKVVIISAGPYRSSAVEFTVSLDGETLHLDFYSALRTGFGRLPNDDVEKLKLRYL